MFHRIVVTRLLKNVLLADALISIASALVMSLGATALAPWLGLPDRLLFAAGLALMPYAALVGWAAVAPSLPRGLLPATIAINLLWAAGCVELLLTLRAGITPLGQAFIGLHIGTVLVFAQLQWLGLHRAPRSAAGG